MLKEIQHSLLCGVFHQYSSSVNTKSTIIHLRWRPAASLFGKTGQHQPERHLLFVCWENDYQGCLPKRCASRRLSQQTGGLRRRAGMHREKQVSLEQSAAGWRKEPPDPCSRGRGVGDPQHDGWLSRCCLITCCLWKAFRFLT